LDQRKHSQLKFKEVPLNKICFSDDRAPDDKNVRSLIDSILVRGVLQPLIVKRIVERGRGGKKIKKIILIAGRDRYEAAQLADLKTVPCVFVQGDETDLQITALSENLHRKSFHVFERAEMTVKFYDLASRSADFSDHRDRKFKRGRPSSGVSRAARKLPDVCGSFEARRQRLSRAKRILSLGPEVREAAIGAGLANNQRALLRIGKPPRKSANWL
jgi:ParB family transcriptional regulator, chromosome partitioning protein